MPGWYQGVWWSYTYDPFVPRQNLKYGLKIWRLSGWQAWGL